MCVLFLLLRALTVTLSLFLKEFIGHLYRAVSVEPELIDNRDPDPDFVLTLDNMKKVGLPLCFVCFVSSHCHFSE
jgi:hypothetical protein